MIKTVIIDDEINARELLEKMLNRYFPQKFIVCDLCESIDEAVKSIEKYKPDLVFLDIQMPNKSGFELFKEIKEIDFEVIFTTAHSKYAIEAIKRSALDYLLKPINYLDLLESVSRYENKTKKENQQKQLRVLLENIDSGEAAHKKMAIPTETGFEFLKFNSIVFLEAQSNYTKFYLLNSSTITTSKTLKYFESILPESLFFRIHKTYMVNLNFVVRFTKVDDFIAELITGHKLPVSIRKKDDFISAVTRTSNI